MAFVLIPGLISSMILKPFSSSISLTFVLPSIPLKFDKAFWMVSSSMPNASAVVEAAKTFSIWWGPGAKQYRLSLPFINFPSIVLKSW